MNTLPRAITAHVLTDPDLYYAIRQQWSELMRSTRRRELIAAHHILYLALIGKDWRKGFTCATNQRKLDNGAFYGWVLFRAVESLHLPSCEAELLAPFGGVVTPLMLEHIRNLIPDQSPSSYRPEQFTPANFPFEAYRLPASFQTAAADERNSGV